MKLSIDILLDKLGQYNIRSYSDANTEPELDYPRLLCKGASIESTNFLYVGYGQDVDVHDVLPGSSIVSIGIPNGFSDELTLEFNLMIVNESIRIDTLFNKIMDLFLYFNQWEMDMHELIVNGSDLQDFINASDEVLGWPISIIDRAEKTLATSRFKDSDDIIWNELCNGHIHTELLLKDSVKISEIIQFNKPVQRYSTISERVILSQAIRVSGHVVGFVATHHPQRSEQLFSIGVEHLVNYFTNFIAKRMRCNEFYNMSRGSMFEYLLVDLIEGHINDAELIEDRLLFLNWNLDKNKMLLRIEAPQKSLSILRDHLNQVIPHNHCIIYNGGLVAIVSGLDESLSPASLEQLLSFLNEYHAQCGMSNLYSSLLETTIHFQQARIALKFGNIHRPDHVIYQYSEYTIHHALSILAKHADLHDFYHQAFKRLLPLTKTSSILFDTLRVYLQTNCNIAASAKLLFIHRNSMIYRIKRLEEELLIDFFNPNTRLQLLMSYEIYDSLNSIQYDEGKSPSLAQFSR